MVCKEELCRWFKTLSARKRIEYMCTLLHMCVPLELRFLGSFLEEIGKKDYHHLRDAELKANNPAELAKYRDLPADKLRSKIMVCLALLHSANTTCAQIIYDFIESSSAFNPSPSDDNCTIEDVLTILTLAIHHPAFLFEHNLRLHEHLVRLDNKRKEIWRDTDEEEEVSLDFFSEPHLSYSGKEHISVLPATMWNRHLIHHQLAYIQRVEVKNALKPQEKKGGPDYVIHALWTNGEVTEVCKKYREIQDFHNKIQELYDEKPPKQNGRIPPFPAGSQHSHSTREDFLSEQIRSLNAYFKTFTDVPSYILQCDHVTQFFKGVVVQSPSPQSPQLHIMPPPHAPVAPDDGTNRMPRYFPYYSVSGAPPRFPHGQAYTYPAPAFHLLPHHQQQPPHLGTSRLSPNSSTTSSPNNSHPGSPAPHGAVTDMTVSVTQLLRLLNLEKYSEELSGLTVEELSGFSSEEMGKLGLPRDVQVRLRSRLDQIPSTDKPSQMNGLIDHSAICSTAPSSPSVIWQTLGPNMYNMSYNSGLPNSPRSVYSAADSSPAPSDVASPPPSPSLAQMKAGFQSNMQTGDSSEGSEDLERDKNEESLENEKGELHPHSKMSLSGSGGLHLNPTEDSIKVNIAHSQKPPLLPLMPLLHYMLPLHHTHHAHTSNPNPAPGLLGQYVDPKAESGLLGVTASGPNSNNNNGYGVDPNSIMSSGITHRHTLLQSGVGTPTLRTPFKGGQPPQPAHTNMTGVMSGKGLITLPTENLHPKPGSPIIHMPTYLGLRPSEIQPPVNQGLVTNTVPLPDALPPHRMPFYLPFGRGQTALPSGQPPGVLPLPALATRCMQSTLATSSVAITVAASHPATFVTASHSAVSTPTATASLRSPSHNINSNGQRDSGVESGGSVTIGCNDSTQRTSPLQAGGVSNLGNMTAAPSPPASVPCSECAQQGYLGAPVQVLYNHYPFWYTQNHNGYIPAGMSSFSYSHGQPLHSSMLANGYTPEMYPYNHPGYPSIMPTGHINPMFYGNSNYHGAHPHNSTVSAGGGMSAHTAALGATSVTLGHTISPTVKQRTVGCYNCGSFTHRPTECQENTMEVMSGHFHLNYKPPRSDSD